MRKPAYAGFFIAPGDVRCGGLMRDRLSQFNSTIVAQHKHAYRCNRPADNRKINIGGDDLIAEFAILNEVIDRIRHGEYLVVLELVSISWRSSN
jgi:hypothetical protein